MQWIFALAGLVLGGALEGSFAQAIIGALAGLGLAQGIRLSALGRQCAEQRLQLEQAQQSLTALGQRLARLEPDTGPQMPASIQANEAPAAEPELIWELPDELVSAPESIPPVADAWHPALSASVLPSEPSVIEKAWTRARDWLVGGNTVLRVGVLLLFLGLAFLLRYASEHLAVPVEFRYIGVATTALVLLGLGWWLRGRQRQYALVLQGAGVAVLYLTVFAAMRLHTLLEPAAAFGLLVALTVFSGIMALKQDALGLAAAAALGGFAAPILASSGDGNPVVLFSYFALLNAGILAIAWFKAWRLLDLIGFIGTFGIGVAWGLRTYTPELFWSTEPFLLLFLAMYLGIGLLYARRRLLEATDTPVDDSREALLRWSVRQGGYADGSLLFGPPIVGFGLQYALVQHLSFGPALSALGLGAVYLLLARALATRVPERACLLVETCVALGVVFASLAIPLGLDARWTSAAWAVEGAGIFWLGVRQQRLSSRCFALLLQAGAALAFLAELRPGRDASLIYGAPLGALLLGVAVLFSFYQLRKATPEQARAWERKALPWLACIGLGFVYLLAPLCFEYQGTTIAWAVAGLVTLLAGLPLQSRAFLACALSVQVLAGLLFLLFGPGFTSYWMDEGARPLLHGDFWAPMLVSLVAMISAWRLDLDRQAVFETLYFPRLCAALLLWGAGWWALTWVTEVQRFVPFELQATQLLLASALSVALWALLALRLRWSALATLCTLLMPAAAWVLVWVWEPGYHPAANFGALAWLAVLLVHGFSLKRLAGLILPWARSAAHVLGCWLIIGVLTLELRYGLLQLWEHYSAWRWLGWALLPSLYLVLMAAPRVWPWPVSAYGREYRWWAVLPLAVLMLLWFWLANIASDGRAWPLPYLPLLNPLELGLLFALFGVHAWSRSALAQAGPGLEPVRQGVIGLSLFFFFTVAVMRTAHQWGAVPFEFDALLASM